MALKLNGKPLQLHQEPPTVATIRKFLDKSSSEDLYTKNELAAKSGVAEGYVRDVGTKQSFAEYTFKVGSVRYWGNPKAIAELRKQVAR